MARPLGEAVRGIQGVAGAFRIAMDEAEELREVRRQYDGIPLEKLNGQRVEVSKELGDLTFGVALALGMLSIEQMSQKQRNTLLYWTNFIKDTELTYNLDAVASGIEVNRMKNVVNNPTWAYADYHPLDNPVQAVDRHDDVRRGLRVIRDMDPQGVLVEENLAYAVDYMGYLV